MEFYLGKGDEQRLVGARMSATVYAMHADLLAGQQASQASHQASQAAHQASQATLELLLSTSKELVGRVAALEL